MLLREVLDHNLANESAVYVALLDARKAFDTVWHNGIFFKLYTLGCNNVLWRILKDYYDNFQCCAFVAGRQSGWFDVLQGVHQGGPLSMKMYMVFNNDLLDLLCRMDGGASISYINFPLVSPAFADDISIVTLHKPHMQLMLNVAYRHSCMWRYEFNPAKSHVIIFGRDLCPMRQLCMGEQPIDIVECDTHLGVPLASKPGKIIIAMNDRVNIGRRNFFASLSLGSRSCPMSPVIVSKLYWSVVIPQMTYGLELLNLPSRAIAALESAHISMAKAAQGLPRSAANAAALPALGWLTLRSWLAYKRFMFMWHILLASMDCIYKYVLVERLMHLHYLKCHNQRFKGPIVLMYETCLEYGLLEYVINAVRTGQYISNREWKRKVKDVIWQRERYTYVANCNIYKSMTLYKNCISPRNVWPWWLFAKRHPCYVQKCRVMFRLLTGNNAIAERLRQAGISRTCQQCSMMVADSISHMLFECECANQTRRNLWANIIRNAPEALVEELSGMTHKVRSEFLLSGLNNSVLVYEWDSLLIAVCQFVVQMYDHKVSLM